MDNISLKGRQITMMDAHRTSHRRHRRVFQRLVVSRFTVVARQASLVSPQRRHTFTTWPVSHSQHFESRRQRQTPRSRSVQRWPSSQSQAGPHGQTSKFPHRVRLADRARESLAKFRITLVCLRAVSPPCQHMRESRR